MYQRLSPLPDTEWTWSAAAQKKWDVLTDGYQDFYEHWLKIPANTTFPDTFPYNLSLGKDTDGLSLLPFDRESTSGDEILITRAYDSTFHRLLRLRKDDTGKERGVVLTGQPGIGASMTRSPPCDNLPAHLGFRKNYLPKVHARAADFRSRGRNPV